MRVNIEDSVKRHLPRLMREMGWSHREVIGALCCVWGATQDAEIYEAPADRVHTVCAIDFDDDVQCTKFITAMISAQLITVLDDGTLRVRGNKEHVERLQRLRSQAPNGGRARQAKKSNDFGATSEPSPSHARAAVEPIRSAPSSLLLTPNTGSNSPPTQQVGSSPTQTSFGGVGQTQKKKRGRRAEGTNPRALGTNPRKTGKAPRVQRQAAKAAAEERHRKAAELAAAKVLEEAAAGPATRTEAAYLERSKKLAAINTQLDRMKREPNQAP